MGATATPIQTGRTEQIRLDVRTAGGQPVTGATDVQIRIQRSSDGFFYDFDDDTFKSTGFTEKDTALVEIDSTDLPGLYELTGGFDSGAVTNLTADDTYVVFPVKGPAADTASAVMPNPGEFKVGWYADAVGLDAIVSATIGSGVPDTLELAAWLVRNATPVTAGLVSATVEIQTAAGAVIVASGAMTGPNAAGVFTRSVPSVTLAAATNYVALLTITDAVGAQTSYTAIPTLG